MPDNGPISGFTEMGATVPAAADELVVVDKSDTTDAATGTTKRWEWLDFLRELFATRFGADAGANDTYVVTLTPAPAAYVTGEHYRFKANTANTGACTVNFNSLGAKAIKKAAGGITTDLADNDIRAGQWVDLVYDGTNMQMQSLLGNAPAGGAGGIGDVVGPGSSTDNALVRFDSTTGKLIQDSTVTLDDTGAVTVPEMAAPSTPASGKVAIYAKTDGKLYIKDDAGTETDLTATSAGTIGGSTGATDNALLRADGTGGSTVQGSTISLDDAGAMTFPEMVAPSTPASGNVVLYAKSDGLFYSKDDAGTETVVTGGGGGSIAPLEIVDANTVRQINGANAQEFRVHANATELLFVKTVSGAFEVGSSTRNTKVVAGSTKYEFTGAAVLPSGATDLGSTAQRWATLFSNAFNLVGGGVFRWNSSTKVTDIADGWIHLEANAGSSSVVKLSFGISNSSGPMLKRSASASYLEVKRADDSANTFLVSAGGLFTSAQFDKTDTTLANVTGLVSETLNAGKTYTFEAVLFVDADVTGGSKYAIAGTATATATKYEIVLIADATNLMTITSRQTALGGSAGQAGTTAGMCRISGTVTVNAAGTLAVQFAQNAANGTSSVLTMSKFEVRQLD